MLSTMRFCLQSWLVFLNYSLPPLHSYSHSPNESSMSGYNTAFVSVCSSLSLILSFYLSPLLFGPQ